MVTKTKKASQKPLKRQPKLIEMVCEGCGLTVSVLKGSKCQHCGQQMVENKAWRKEYYG